MSVIVSRWRCRTLVTGAGLAVLLTLGSASDAICACRQPMSGADMRALERAMVVLPAVGSKQFPMVVGTIVPRELPTKAVPKIVSRILPGHSADRAFRSGHDLVIVDLRSRRIAHVLRTGRLVDASCS